MTYARERLAPKPERVNRGQVLEAFEFRGGEAFANEREIVARDTAAVVGDVNEFEATVADLNVYRGRASVQAVLN